MKSVVSFLSFLSVLLVLLAAADISPINFEVSANRLSMVGGLDCNASDYDSDVPCEQLPGTVNPVCSQDVNVYNSNNPYHDLMMKTEWTCLNTNCENEQRSVEWSTKCTANGPQ